MSINLTELLNGEDKATIVAIVEEAIATIGGVYDIEFSKRYLGSFSTPPTTDNEGLPLIAGALYYDTSKETLRVFLAGNWKNVGFDLANATHYDYKIGTTAGTTVGQTEFTGLQLENGIVDVFYNGSKLFPNDDYTYTDGTVTLLNGGCVLDDVIQIYNYRYPVDVIDGGTYT